MPQEIRNCVYQGNLNTLLFKLNTNVNWRTLFGNPKEDSRMRDLEFILRFFGLNTSEILDAEKGNISLKKHLNEYMGAKANNTQAKVTSLENDFNITIETIFKQFGETAFYNVLASDLTTIRRRFYPTVFDAIMIATSIALIQGVDVTKATEENRLNLLRDESFREFSTQGTMQIEHIKGRVTQALKYLYNI